MRTLMKKLFALLALVLCGMTPGFGNQELKTNFQLALKQRQPNWRFEMVQSYANGLPQIILFYEPTVHGERAVQQTTFYENNRIQTQMDVVLIDEDSNIAKEWGSSLVPHGARLDYSSEGALVKFSNYQAGVLNGECKVFYPNGNLQNECIYQNGILTGAVQAYYENGKIKEEAYYEMGQLVGEVAQY